MLTVVIADDEPNILLSLEFLMKKEGHRVFIARDGAEAQELIDAEKPDLLLLDVMMPKMNGHELCRYVRAQPDLNHAKVIFLSARSKEADVQAGYEAGANLYIPKPFSTRDLVSRINQLMKPVG
ncbi:DNA-binding response OmpR family regulator [Spirosoma lacussanchae]|uniref:Response regulator n=1 Tax=Spirosoma sordidisoli TaxID=2502893 RepID=A0A4Q2URE4_9BACT|nr:MULTISPECIES: response regulator [Spirosoma]RYC71592.1 response regulator [Spirosoma sordidisoli]